MMFLDGQSILPAISKRSIETSGSRNQKLIAVAAIPSIPNIHQISPAANNLIAVAN